MALYNDGVIRRRPGKRILCVDKNKNKNMFYIYAEDFDKITNGDNIEIFYEQKELLLFPFIKFWMRTDFFGGYKILKNKSK